MLNLQERASVVSTPSSGSPSDLRPLLDAQAGVPSATERASVHVAGGVGSQATPRGAVNLGRTCERSRPRLRTNRRPLRGAWRSSTVSCCVMPFAQRRGWLERVAPALLLLAAAAAIAWGMCSLERVHAESRERYRASAPLGGWER